MNYGHLFRWRLAPDELKTLLPKYDLLISAYNGSERVQSVFSSLNATEQCWIIQPEYEYSASEYPDNGRVIAPQTDREGAFANAVLKELGRLDGICICVDATGFMRHTLLALLRKLIDCGCVQFWLLYSDPSGYVADDLTKFSTDIRYVRQVDGYHGTHDASLMTDDVLVLGTGYDQQAMRAVIEDKRSARRLDLVGLPSLQPSMYQENMISIGRLDNVLGSQIAEERIFAAANDPLATATALHRSVSENGIGDASNIYLAPTGTKAQVIGFGLFYIMECVASPVSVILPFPASYSKTTSKGHARSWVYEIDMSILLTV